MKKLIVPLLLITMLYGCSADNNRLGLIEYLVSLVNHEGHSEQYTACVLLSNLPYQPRLEQLLNAKTVISGFASQCYLLLKSTSGPEGVSNFLTNLPAEKDIKIVFEKHEDAGYPLGILPPFVERLIELALNNDIALNKKVETYLLSDGVFSESLSEEIAKIYNQYPNRVTKILENNEVSDKDIQFIEQTAQYLIQGSNK